LTCCLHNVWSFSDQTETIYRKTNHRQAFRAIST